jgi:hypothetical protein
MRARPNLSGEQLVTDYLTRVAQAARLLPKGARMAFVGRTRALIEREVGPPGTRTDPEQVIAALARLGEPEDLVLTERTRIDQGWVKSRAASKEEGEAAAAALSGPRMNRRLTARRRPNSDTQPLTGRLIPPGSDETVTGPDGSVTGPDGSVTGPDGYVTGAGPTQNTGPRRSVLRGAGPRTAGVRTSGLRNAGPGGAPPRSADPRGADPRSAVPRSAAPRGADPGSSAPRRLRSADSPGTGPQAAGPKSAGPQGLARQGTGAGAGDTGHTGHTRPIDWLIGQVPGKRRASGGTETFTANASRLARDNILEAVAILLLGLGGLILPFPLWPIGAVVSMFSRLWDIKDKALAVTGPLLVTLAVSVLAAVFVGGSGNIIVAYFHALRVDFGLMLRVGSVITAAYLAWRVSKGPRVKTPPWRRITR